MARKTSGGRVRRAVQSGTPPQGHTARPVHVLTEAEWGRRVLPGIGSVYAISASELRENGGKYRLLGGPAEPLVVVEGTPDPHERTELVYVVEGELPAGATAASTLLTGLTSWWRLEEESGARVDAHSSNDLADNNTVLFAAGKQGNAASFNRTNSEYLSSTSTELQTGDIDFTVACWYYKIATGNLPAMGRWATGNQEYLLSVDGGNWNWRIGDKTVTIASPAPASGVWFCLIAWYDSATKTGYFQINDNAPSSVASVTISAATATFMIGRNEQVTSGPDWHMHGQIDEAAFWKKVLTSAERDEYYNGGAGIAYPG